MIMNRLGIVALLALGYMCSVPAFAETADEIVLLSKQGADEKALLAAIERNETGFQLTLDQANAYRKAGVPESAVLAMLRQPAAVYTKHGSFMNAEIGRPLGIVITGWKIIGFLGVLLFSGRWLVQLYYSRKAGRPVMGRAFWLMSMSGSLLLLTYFVIGKNDSVGVLSNMFPCVVAAYNLYLDIRYHRTNGVRADEAPSARAVRASKAEQPAEPIEVAAGQ